MAEARWHIFTLMLACGNAAFAEAPGWPEPVEDNLRFGKLITDQLEVRNDQGSDSLRWDMQGWYGTDIDKLWLKSEGENLRRESSGDLEFQGLYSRMIAPFWDFQAGLRYDRVYGDGPERDRAFAVVGFQGLAPYRFELEPAIFISDDGDVSARITGTYDLLLTQRLILQPRLEVNVAASAAHEYGVGRGVNDVELGARLRYEIRREFAPYLGVNWRRSFADTADLARLDGSTVSNFAIVAGVRIWF